MDITSSQQRVAIDESAEDTIKTCNELLRGELSAVETYTQAIEKFDGEDLLRIRANHQKSVAELRGLILDGGGEPSMGSGLWGGFARAIEGAAKLVGESPALKILQEGEEHGIKEYREALANPDVSGEVKELIRHVLLPPLSAHVADLRTRRELASA